jgi:hypothetical protein
MGVKEALGRNTKSIRVDMVEVPGSSPVVPTTGSLYFSLLVMSGIGLGMCHVTPCHRLRDPWWRLPFDGPDVGEFSSCR